MKAANRKNWKHNALGASVLAVSAAVGYTGISTVNADPSQQTIPGAPTVPQGRGGRSGGRGHNDLQALSANPPAIELAPAASSVEPTQSTDMVAGADYYEGTYYGDPVNAGRWGTMQVVVVIENGVLADVQIAQYPHSTYESNIIARAALPRLISEAITAQDSNVDFVSRATDSSRAFVLSLDSALLDAAIGMDL